MWILLNNKLGVQLTVRLSRDSKLLYNNATKVASLPFYTLLYPQQHSNGSYRLSQIDTEVAVPCNAQQQEFKCSVFIQHT
eukprot:6192365-Pleurochrysis_carterae.AAC.4